MQISLTKMSNIFSRQEAITMVFTINSTTLNFNTPSTVEISLTHTLVGITGIIMLYLWICLCVYEAFYPEKPPAGRILRILLLITATIGLLFEITRILSLAKSNKSNSYCFGTTLAILMQYTFFLAATYTFFWVRQHTFYSNPQLHHLKSKKRTVFSYVTLTLIIFDNVTLLILLAIDPQYRLENGICTYFQYFPPKLRIYTTVIIYTLASIQVSTSLFRTCFISTVQFSLLYIHYNHWNQTTGRSDFTKMVLC